MIFSPHSYLLLSSKFQNLAHPFLLTSKTYLLTDLEDTTVPRQIETRRSVRPILFQQGVGVVAAALVASLCLLVGSCIARKLKVAFCMRTTAGIALLMTEEVSPKRWGTRRLRPQHHDKVCSGNYLACLCVLHRSPRDAHELRKHTHIFRIRLCVY